MSTPELDAQPFFLGSNEGHKDIAADLLVRKLASAVQTNGEFGLIEFSGVRGYGPPSHRHGNESESFFILDGNIRVFVEDIIVLCKPGDFVYIPKNARHKFIIESDFGRFLCFISPGGFEEFFTEIGTATDHPVVPVPGTFPTAPSGNFLEIGARFAFSIAEEWDDNTATQ